jgi:hypothetical protein
MVIREHRDIESKSDKSKNDKKPPLEDCGDVEYPVDKNALVIRISLNVQIKDVDVEQRMKKIFHTRCHIKNKVYSIIIDITTCVNVASAILVRKLNLNIIKHERPYRFQWLNGCREVRVTKQVLIIFVVGKY